MYRLNDQCGKYLSTIARQDEKIWVIDGDLADSNGAISFLENCPDQFLMAGIAEQSMVSMAAGMAQGGLKPWVFSFASFLCYRAYDQIRTCISQTNSNVVLVGSHAGGFTGRNGQSHAALNDIGLLSSLPNFSVWAPGDRADVEYLVNAIIQDNAPAYVRLPREPLPDLPGAPALYRTISREGKVAILSYGIASQLALEAQDILTKHDVAVDFIHCLKIFPLPASLLTVLAAYEAVFIVEDHYRLGGLSSILNYYQLKNVHSLVHWESNYTGKSGSFDELVNAYGFHPETIAEKIIVHLEPTRKMAAVIN